MNIVPQWVQSLSEKILSPIWLLGVICFFCGMLGYLPKEILSGLQLSDGDAVFYQGLRVIFWFTLALLAAAFFRYLASITRKIISSSRPPKFDILTDPEQAVLYILDVIPGKTLEIHDDWNIGKMLVDKNLIKQNFYGIVIVPKDPFEDYSMTDLGKAFVKKNTKRLDEKFSNKEKTASLINPYLKTKVGHTVIPSI